MICVFSEEVIVAPSTYVHVHVSDTFKFSIQFVGHYLHEVCSECKKEAKQITASTERALLVT